MLDALAAGPLGASAVARLAGADHSTLRSLERRGLVSLEQAADAPRRPVIEGVGARRGGVEPTAAQRAALEAIVERLGQPPGRPLLLHGVTGSGKTEVYLRAVAAALERGQSAIVLVPEIALTPQTAGRFVERFGDAVAIMHSQLSQRERYDEWWRMRRGEARVCVGPRSAVFAPFEDLGLIVVDEEHDSSYKQEGDPRYDARVVAERRAQLEGALLLAGQRHAAAGEPGALRAAGAARARRRPRRCRRWRWSAWPGCPARCTSARARSWTEYGGGARRRSSCSTGAGGRTSSPARSAGASGSARTAT